jgi:hypothetical protein
MRTKISRYHRHENNIVSLATLKEGKAIPVTDP